MKGAGKTSLVKAIMGQGRVSAIANLENLLPDLVVQEIISGGIYYCDSVGLNLQVLFFSQLMFMF